MLVNCAAYQHGRKLADLGVDEISGYLERPDCFVWVALKEPTEAELAALQAEFGLHPLAVEDAQHGHQRPKVDEFDHSLFAVLHLVEPIDGELHVGEVAIFVGANYAVSVRRDVERGFTDVRARCEQEPELLKHGPAYVLYALMDATVDRYFPVLDQIETELEAIEARIFRNEGARGNLEALYALKSELMVLKHAINPLLESLSRLYGGRVPALCAPLQDYFRDVADHLVRLNQSIDGARDTIITAISVNLSLITIQETEVTKRLAGYGALIAVPTMIAGVYGMNFRAMPELDWRYGYPFALLMMLVLDLWVFLRLRRAKWL